MSAPPRRRLRSERLVAATPPDQHPSAASAANEQDAGVDVSTATSRCRFDYELQDNGNEDSGHSAREVAPARRKRARYDRPVAANGHGASAVEAVDGTVTAASDLPDSGPQHLFRVGRMKEFHATWAELMAYIEYYKYATKTSIEVHDTVTVAQLNAALGAAHQAEGSGSGSALQRPPESLQVYSRTFVCAGAGRQADQERCPFKFMARVVREEEKDDGHGDTTVWWVQVPYVNERCVHNHPVFGGVRVAYQIPESCERDSSRAPVRSSQQQQHFGRTMSIESVRRVACSDQDSDGDDDRHQMHKSDAENGGGGDESEQARPADRRDQDFGHKKQEESEPQIESVDMDEEEKENDVDSTELVVNESDGENDNRLQFRPQIFQSLPSRPPPEFLLKEYHASWEHFFGFLDDYMHASGVKLVNSDCLSVANRNKKIQGLKQGAGRGSVGGLQPSRELVPAEWKMYNRRFVCMHGRPKRSAGGQRQETAAAAAETPRCQFQLVAKVVKVDGAWCVQLPHYRQMNVHNHSVRTLAVFHNAAQRSTAEEESRPVLSNGSQEQDEGHQHQHGDAIAQPPKPEDPVSSSVFQVKEYHASWEAFSAYIGELMAQTWMRVTIAETVKVPKRNKTLLESSRARRGLQQVDLIPGEWQLYLRRYICVHGRPSKPGRSRGLRTHRQRVPITGCGFRFTARVERGRDGNWCIHVPPESQFCDHNHPNTGIVSASSNNNIVSSEIRAPAVEGVEDEDEDNREGQGSDEFGNDDCERTSVAEHQFREVEETGPAVAAGDIVLARTADSPYILTAFHDSWADFFAYLATYMRATSSKVVIKETINVASRNRKLLASTRVKRGGRVNLIPETLKPYSRTFICTRGWTTPSRSQGLRPRSVAPRTVCPFRFTATVVMVDAGVWRIHVPLYSQLCTHNHSVTREAVERGITSELQQLPVTERATRGSNMLDIDAIPRDHPLYDAICELAKQQQQQQQQQQVSSTTRGVDTRAVSGEVTTSHLVPVFNLNPQLQDDEDNGSEAAGSEDLGENDDDEEDAGQDAGEQESAAPVDVAAVAAATTVRNDDSDAFQVQVASIQEFHISWESLTEYLDTYMRATFTRVAIKDVLSAAIRNRKILQIKRGQQGGMTQKLIPPEFKIFSRQYICTHGWASKQRNQGLRQPREVRATGCKFQFIASVVKHGDRWLVRVPLRTQVCVHNHPVDQERFERYGSVRTVPKTHPVYDQVRQMVLAGAKRAAVYDFIHANSTFKVTKKDVDNMTRAIKKTERQRSACE